jgi:hypothetical protein
LNLAVKGLISGPRLLRRARLILFLLAVLCAGLPGCRRPPTREAPATPAQATNGPVLFAEVGAELGLAFTHDSAATGGFFMPEHIGSGGAFLDFDDDGRLDVLLLQHGGPRSPSKHQLFHQGADGRFTNVSAGSGLDISGYGMGATVGDVDNDGLPDVFITEYGAVRLFLNRAGGKFVEVTRAAGLDNSRWSTAASFLDYDRDGWLDLFVGNYVDYLPEHQCFDPAGAPDFCGPQNFQNTVSRLFHNLGRTGPDGRVRFEDVTLPSGVARATGKALGVLATDFSGDRWPDIFVADDGIPNRLYINQRDGTFVEEATLRGLAYNAMGATAGNMGIGLGDVNRDGLFDLFITHLAHEQHTLWVQGPPGSFADQTHRFGLINPAWRGTGFGTVLADFDLDGWPDLAHVNGTIRRGAAHPGPRLPGLIPFWSEYAQRYQLFLNDAHGRFVDVSSANPAFCGRAGIGRGLACGDVDNDGGIDLLAICAGGPVQLFRNVAPRRGHWLSLRARDPSRGGRDAIGAEVFLESGSQRFWGLVQPSVSYLVSHDPRVHFGLGPVSSLDRIRVLWPDGTTEVFPGGAVDRFITVRQGEGREP